MRRFVSIVIIAAGAGAAGCSGGKEAVPVDLPVVVAAGGLGAATTDLGWSVEISECRMALRDLQFTIEGEQHASLWRRAADWLVPPAHAHPGHSAGGEVTGELAGDLIVDLKSDGASLGTGTLLEGQYNGANFTFRRAGAADGLDPGDPLLGHTAVIAGTASQAGTAIGFRVVLDVDDGAQVVGLPMDLEVKAGVTTATLGLAALLVDPIEGDTLLDGVDFAALDGDGDGQVAIEPGQPTHNVIVRAVQVHDQYRIEVR